MTRDGLQGPTRLLATVTLPLALTLPVTLGCGGAARPSAPVSEPATPGDGGATSAASSALAASPPDFELEALSGDFVRLSDHLGKQVVLIDFWATFCHPCLAAMPHLQDLYEKYQGQGLVILGVSIDGPQSVAQVRGEVARLGVTFPILLDQESQVIALYNPKTSAPFSVLIGRDGRILAKKEGYSTSSGEQLHADIQRALQ